MAAPATESQPLCTKCKAEPRVPGQRWGLRCRAAAAAAARAHKAVPHETRGTVSRREQSAKIDQWLKENRGRLERESETAIALELRRLGFYSQKTTVIDIRVSVMNRASQLGLPFKHSILNPP